MILASASPRRYELLHRVGIEPEVRPAHVDETAHPGEKPTNLVERLARLKAQAVWDELTPTERDESDTGIVLAADTIVWTPELGILGKPHTHEQAMDMLRRLSGRTHAVSTGVCLISGAPRKDGLVPNCQNDSGSAPEPQLHSFVDTTKVTFFSLSDEEIRSYVDTGEPMDKAGAYGIQGIGRLFVRSIEGDYNNVVGLPVAHVVRELGELLGRDVVSELLQADKGQELVTYDE